MISARPIPHDICSAEELESWLSSQKLVMATVEDVPHSWIEASASQPDGFILLTSKSTFAHLGRVKGDESNYFGFEAPLRKGQALIVKKSFKDALAA